MKKLYVILLASILMIANCGSREMFELALITDLGTIDDKSFNQGAWEGLIKFAEEYGVSSKYYQPNEKSDDAYLTAIDLAVQGGAKIIVIPGYLFVNAVLTAQDRYSNVNFIWLDGDAGVDLKSNVVCVLYAEDQAGFLAGYAAVKDGYRKLGFAGGMAVPAVVRFGYGFIQGAEYAAQELRLAPNAVTINYHYTGGFSATLEVQTLAASWYSSGVEVIFACGGQLGSSVMAAAEQTNGKVIGVDRDQSFESPSVITSAMKVLSHSVYSNVFDCYAGNFSGGKSITFKAENDGVGLPMDTSAFRNFNINDYNVIFNKLVDGVIPRMLDDPADSGSPDVVPVSLVRIIEVK